MTRGQLLDLDGPSGGLQLFLGLVRLLLRDLLQDRLRGPVDEVLGLLEPEAGEGPDLLDDLDLLVTGRGEDHVELGLLLGLLSSFGSPRAPRHRRHRGSHRRSLHLKRLLEFLDELRKLKECHPLEGLQEVIRGCLLRRRQPSYLLLSLRPPPVPLRVLRRSRLVPTSRQCLTLSHHPPLPRGASPRTLRGATGTWTGATGTSTPPGPSATSPGRPAWQASLPAIPAWREIAPARPRAPGPRRTRP